MNHDAEREQHLAEQAAYTERLEAMVVAQAPRLFAAVVTRQGGTVEQTESRVFGWGMEFDDGAYMVTAGGSNHFFLSEADNALNYIREAEDTIKDIVWVPPAAPTTDW
ncbi:hypothetical protein [Kibdelosporangium phytohabitans]|uniref:Uncharacterized protein n=1 Tax=Kibdelosporangium phytohabitans TaxID=860235 RepID=A0A0N9IAG5_9PSEU|nr:hypothetical protein [Kibdelosporangium phytohabitans]ALG11465.1 hypothetical protein AOZ06_35475 [Kibdelosporangium phytohabitans]MBE1462811.1 hypothetical protein [Kibdelosporangium phytohabitans]